MGYQTVMNVPTIRDYKEALIRFNKSKPIKGRDDDKRPLGQRRYVDTYSIRKNVWTESIECVLYQTPVVTYTVEDEVKVKFGTWSSASTCQFIDRLLWNVRANRVRGDVVLHFNDGTKALVRDHEELVLVRGENGAWMPKETQTLYDYRVSRKEANNVRKSVSQFRDYLAGVTKLKGEEITYNKGTHYERTSTRVQASYAELIEVFGCVENDGESPMRSGKFRPNADMWQSIHAKPKYFHEDNRQGVWANYNEQTTKFFDLVRNDQDDNARHQNYWIAFNILLVQDQRLYWRDDLDYNVSVSAEHFEKFLERILFAMFSDKVFKRVALPTGKVPTGKYDSYVLAMED